jgi:hypothetical protein
MIHNSVYIKGVSERSRIEGTAISHALRHIVLYSCILIIVKEHPSFFEEEGG